MTITDALMLLLALGAGILLGGIFYGGLWWTIRRTMSFQNPGLWFLGSLLLRTGVTMAGFYLVAGNRVESLLVCLLGFVIARVVAIRLTASTIAPTRGAIHAP